MNLFELGFGQTENEISVDQLSIQGYIPSWLEGTLIRNGPGTFKVGDEYYCHWFDGLAMLHKFSFVNGQVSYMNRFLECDAYNQAKSQGKIVYSEFATDPCQTLFGRLKSVFSPKVTDSAKVSIGKIANQYMAYAETPIQVSFDPETLKSAGVMSYEPALAGQMTTVHPHYDYGRNEAYNMVTRFHQVSHYNIYRVGSSWKPERIASVPVNQPSYMHSFGMTQNYFIIIEFPLVVNPLSLLLWLHPYIENYHWKPGRGARFWVIHRGNGKVVGKYEGDAFFAFHHVNAFEQGDEIVIDIAAYEDSGILNAYYLDRLKDPNLALPYGNLRRYHLPLKGTHVDYEVISEACMELPNFDYARYNLNENYRYVYASSINPEQRKGFYNQILKVDIKTRQNTIWYEPGCYPGEPIFVGKPERTEEDDGVILSVVLDENKGNSFLLVLDAHTFDEIGRAEIPHSILFGYHGFYFPTE